MKNIIIMGIGRAGKTTLSNMIKNKYQSYNLIHSDCIKWAIIRAKGLEKYYRTNIKEQKEFEHSEEFQKILLEFFVSSIRSDTNNNRYILESGQLSPKLVNEYIDYKTTKVICLGHGDFSKDDIIKLCRTHDTKDDWTYDISDKYLNDHAEKWNEMNQELKRECPKYGIKYVDTSNNRKEILNNLVNEMV